MTDEDWRRMTDLTPIMITEEEWLSAIELRPMLTFLKKQAGNRKLRLFACARCRELWPDLIDPRSRQAIETSELYADNAVSEFALSDAARMADGAHQSIGRQTESEHPHAVAAVSVKFAVGPYCTEFYTYLHPQHQHICPQRESDLFRDIFGNPFRPVAFCAEWRTDTAVALATQMYGSRDFGAMPILADALQDAGCDNDDILNHCRGGGPHVRGCWVVDLVLGKE